MLKLEDHSKLQTMSAEALASMEGKLISKTVFERNLRRRLLSAKDEVLTAAFNVTFAGDYLLDSRKAYSEGLFRVRKCARPDDAVYRADPQFIDTDLEHDQERVVEEIMKADPRSLVAAFNVAFHDELHVFYLADSNYVQLNLVAVENGLSFKERRTSQTINWDCTREEADDWFRNRKAALPRIHEATEWAKSQGMMMVQYKDRILLMARRYRGVLASDCEHPASLQDWQRAAENVASFGGPEFIPLDGTVRIVPVVSEEELENLESE